MEGNEKIDELMAPVMAEIKRHVKDRDAITDIYNRAYEALVNTIDDNGIPDTIVGARRMQAEIDLFKTENERLTARIAELEEETKRTYCAYCGEAFVIDDQAATLVSEHIRTCEKHPLRAYEQENKRLTAEYDACYERMEELQEALRAISIGMLYPKEFAQSFFPVQEG